MSKIAGRLLLSCALLIITSCGGRLETLNNVPAVFIGASIIQYWQNYVDFRPLRWVDRGVAGQKCGDVLARFQTDAIAPQPVTIHLLCGTNDITKSATDPAVTQANIMEMVAEARETKIRIILATLPPVRAGVSMTFPDNTPEQIIAFNEWIRNYARDQDLPLADYYSALVDDDGQLPREFTVDGVHPSEKGYKVMMSVIMPFFR